jgi:hydroxymethylbilane synthase
MIRLRIGTRKSALAQAQANWVAHRLRAAQPSLDVEIVLITTSGDLASQPATSKTQENDTTPRHGLQMPRATTGGLKAMFTKEIEEALLANQIDIAVHSLKDLPATLPAGLTIASIPVREDPRDVWISRRGILFKDIRVGAVIATGAIRRQAQLRHMKVELEFAPIRGNVDTRLKKLKEEGYDGMILALAGLKRLGLESEVTEILPMDVLLPAVGQGALAIEAREGDAEVFKLAQILDDPQSHVAIRAERSFLHALGGSCQTPIAAYAHVSGDRLNLRGLVVAPSGDPYITLSEEGSARDADAIGQYVANELLGRGANKILN